VRRIFEGQLDWRDGVLTLDAEDIGGEIADAIGLKFELTGEPDIDDWKIRYRITVETVPER
jgi:hypothetical protein